MRFCAPCLFGIEGVLADELKRLGADNVEAQNGRVLFSGDEAMLARANIQSRFAERIQILVGSFTARSFEELYQGVRALPWADYIGKLDRFPVKGWSLNSALHSIPDCQSIVKKAVVDKLNQTYHQARFAETGALYQIQFTILKDEVSLLLDTSGAGLHKRGYREISGAAPLKETLAAAIADLARARKAEHIIDPCCGSGTLLIEAALQAAKIAPGKSRRFAAEEWALVPAAAWQEERERAISFEQPDRLPALLGSDVDKEVLALCRDNAEKAGVATHLETAVRDLRKFEPVGDSGTVLCNPPYGERLLDVRTAQDLIRAMGKVFVEKPGWNYAIISPDEDFETLFGRPAKKRRKLYNGMLKCTLYMYF